MIKIPQIEEKNKKKFVADVKPRYRELLERIKKNSKYKKLFDYLLDSDGNILDDRVENIIVGDINILKDVIDKVGVIEENKNENFHKLYINFSKRKLAKRWGETIGVKVCPYCNRSYVFTLDDGIRPQYDHFLPKSKYPYLSVSMYNLIPCCAICNSIKSDHDTYLESMIYPYEEEFGYDIYFKIQSDDVHSSLGLSDDFKLIIDYNKVKIHKDIKKKLDKSIDLLKLEQLYNKHNDYVMMVLKNKYIYSDDYCQSILDDYPLLFSNIEDVKNNLYLSYLEKEHWGDQVLSKLTYDLIKND